MDLTSILAARKRVIEGSAVVGEGRGIAVSSAVARAANPEKQRSALLALGAVPARVTPQNIAAGLVNQGATCYLNSLLQVMWATRELRASCYEWQYDEDLHGEERRSLTRQLQLLFAEMQLTRKAAANTGKLTRSFGWEDGQAFSQNDVHECMSVLFDALDREMFGSPVQPLVHSLHAGSMEHWTTCRGCGTTRTRPEAFISFSLPIRGCADVHAAIQSTMQMELLCGGNQYACETCGVKQDAERRVQLPAASLPPILYLQLHRFDFDYATMRRLKVADACRPALALDMSQYCFDADTVDNPEALAYDLMGVFMHVGDANSGHYFVYVKTPLGWYCYNDSTVTPIPDAQLARALGQPAGEALPPASLAATKATPGSAPAPACGTPTSDAPASTCSAGEGSAPSASSRTIMHDASTGAYMLVYRRRDTAANADAEVPVDAIPADVRARIEEENATYAEARREWEAEQRRIRLRVYYNPTHFSDAEVLRRAPAAAASRVSASMSADSRATSTVAAAVATAAAAASRAAASNTASRSAIAANAKLAIGNMFPPALGGAASDLEVAEVVIDKDDPPAHLFSATLDAINTALTARLAAAPGTSVQGSGSVPSSEAAASTAPAAGARLSINPQLYRIRQYNVLQHVAGEPVAAAPHSVSPDVEAQLAEAMTRLSQPSQRQLIVETRASEDAPWQAWVPGSVPLKLVVCDPTTQAYAPPVVFNVAPTLSTVGDLRAAVAQSCKEQAAAVGLTHADTALPAVRLIVLKESSEEAALVLQDDAEPLQWVGTGTGSPDATASGGGTAPSCGTSAAASAPVRLSFGCTMHVELCPVDGPGSVATSPEGSFVVSQWDTNINTVSVMFNVPQPGGTALESNPAEEHCAVAIDQRRPLRELKEAMSAAIGVPVDDFRMFRSVGGVELKDMGASLTFFGYQGGGAMHLVLGTPLQPDEYEFKWSIALASTTDTLSSAKPSYSITPLGSLALSGHTRVAAVKQLLWDTWSARELPTSSGQVAAFPRPAYMRLRQRGVSDQRLGKVLVDDQTLLQNYDGRLNDGKEITIQITAAEEVSVEGDVLVHLVRWQPATPDAPLLYAPESVVRGKQTWSQLAAQVCQPFGITLAPGALVKLVKPWAWQLQDVANLGALKWTDIIVRGAAEEAAAGDAGAGAAAAAEAVVTLTKAPMFLKNGDLLLFVTGDDYAATLESAAARSGEAAGTAGSSSASGSMPGGRRRETGFKIYSAAEQLEREAEKKAQEEAWTRENEERAEAARAALAAHLNVLRETGAPAAVVDTSGHAEEGGSGVVLPPAPGVEPSVTLSVEDQTTLLRAAEEQGVDKYVRLLQLGLSVEAVRTKMRMDGVDPALLSL